MTNMAKKYDGLKSECFPIAYSEYILLDMCGNRAHVSDQAIINLYHLNPADQKRLRKAIRKAIRKAVAAHNEFVEAEVNYGVEFPIDGFRG